MKRQIRFFALLSFLCFLPTVFFSPASQVQDFMLPSALFPQTSEDYTIELIREMPGNPGFLIFTVESTHGVYDVEGLVGLHKLLYEIKVINALQKQWVGSGFGEGVVESVKDTGRGLTNFVVHPVDSVVGLGRATQALGRKVGSVFRDKEEGEKATLSEKLLGATKRRIANEMGVDVYSRNPHLQTELDSLARARMGGQGALMVVKMLLPITLVASMVLTAGGINSAADQLVNNMSRDDLFRKNREALLALGLGETRTLKLLNSPALTPREATYLRFYLEKLQHVKGFSALANSMIAAKSQTDMHKILYEAQIAAEGEANSRSSELHVLPNALALEKGHTLVWVTAYDDFEDKPFFYREVDRALEMKEKFGKKFLVIWNGGMISKSFSAAMAAKGIKMQALMLFGKNSQIAEGQTELEKL